MSAGLLGPVAEEWREIAELLETSARHAVSCLVSTAEPSVLFCDMFYPWQKQRSRFQKLPKGAFTSTARPAPDGCLHSGFWLRTFGPAQLPHLYQISSLITWPKSHNCLIVISESHHDPCNPAPPPPTPWWKKLQSVCPWVTSVQLRAERRLNLAFNHLTNSHSAHSTNTSDPLYVFQECDEFASALSGKWAMKWHLEGWQEQWLTVTETHANIYIRMRTSFLVAVRAQTTGQNPCRVTFVCLTYTFC